MPEYWLDSNAYMESQKRYYAFDIAPGFWRLLEEQARAGIIASPTLVFDELVRGDDDLVGWARSLRAILFIDPDEAVQRSFVEVADYVQQTYSMNGRDFLSGADPWLIAHAKAHGGVVVTMEVRAPTSRRPKIPDVCDHFGVTTMNLFEMLRRLGARFG